MKLHMKAKVGNYDGAVAELAKRYSPSFVQFPVGNPDVVKYGFQVKDETGFRLVMISNCNHEFEGKDYNVMVTVHGTDAAQVTRQIADLEERLGIKLRDVPDRIKNQQAIIAKLFERMFS